MLIRLVNGYLLRCTVLSYKDSNQGYYYRLRVFVLLCHLMKAIPSKVLFLMQVINQP